MVPNLSNIFNDRCTKLINNSRLQRFPLNSKRVTHAFVVARHPRYKALSIRVSRGNGEIFSDGGSLEGLSCCLARSGGDEDNEALISKVTDLKNAIAFISRVLGDADVR
jgi:hypothetical protein